MMVNVFSDGNESEIDYSDSLPRKLMSMLSRVYLVGSIDLSFSGKMVPYVPSLGKHGDSVRTCIDIVIYSSSLLDRSIHDYCDDIIFLMTDR